MKCQHCGKNEATFYYKSTVNGHTTEARVCQHCAEALGQVAALQLQYTVGSLQFALNKRGNQIGNTHGFIPLLFDFDFC